MSFRRLRAVARKEFLHILRDPRSLIAALAVPLMMLILFGYALSLDVDRVPTIVYDSDRTPESRALIARFEGSRYFQILGATDTYTTIVRQIDRDRCLLAITIERGFARELLAGRAAPVQIILDGSDSNTANIAKGYADALIQSYAFELRQNAINRKGAPKLAQPVDPRLRVLYNEDLKSRNYIVPGLIAVILAIITALITSLTIAREWESGTMEQLLSTPLRPAELVLGKMAAFFTIGFVDTVIAVLFGLFVFEVPLRGSPLLLIGTSCVFLFGALCWGILISALTRKQVMAYQLGMLTSFLPAFLLSGFVYSIDNMPTVIQVVSYTFPSRYFVALLKGIFLKGVGAGLLWGELAFLIAYAAIVFLLATRRLRQKLA